jgi:hypothetical protein
MRVPLLRKRGQYAMYSLEYKMMVQVLRQLGHSGEFHAEVPPRAGLREGGHVVLVVHGGTVISCLILNQNGQKLYHDDDAQRLLLKFGILDWRSAASTSAKSAQTVHPTTPPVKSAENNGRFYPRRLLISEEQMRAWSALERSVYFLADGRHSVEQMARLLSRPLPLVEQIIHDFQVAGLIVLP